MFKLNNIIKLSTNISSIKKIAKNLKIETNMLNIKAKKDNHTIVDIKYFIIFFSIFYKYI